MTVERNKLCIFRNIGATTLFIFERDGTLLCNQQRQNVFLNDINAEIVDVARRLRELGVAFGFISDRKGMKRCVQGGTQAAALIRILDEIMSSGGAAPDFWMAWPPLPPDLTVRQTTSGLQIQTQAMITKAMQSYHLQEKNCVFVTSSPESLIDAAQLGVKTVHYITPKGTEFRGEFRFEHVDRLSNSRAAEILFEKMTRLAGLRLL